MRRANLARFCGDDASRLRPACVQTGRGDGGQYLKMWQIHARAEAPRQRLDEWELGPAPAGRSNWIWLRTGSVYGIPVTPFLTHAWFMCETDGAKGFLFGQKVSVTTYRRSERNCSQLRTPSGEQTQPKSRKGIARDLGELSHPISKQFACGWDRSQRCHSSPRTGKPSTWRRAPASCDRAVADKETRGNLMELINPDKVLALQRKLYGRTGI